MRIPSFLRHSPASVAILAALAVVVFAPSAAVAQSQATTGVIRGVASDSGGAPVPAVTITVRNVATNFQRSVQTNESGAFAATLLPLGTYELTARRIGYRPLTRQGLVVRVGATVDLPLVLARQATELSQVTVTAATPVIDVSRVEAATQLSDEVVSGLPNNGRNYLNLTLLTPNVALASGPDGDELSIAGQRGIHNNVSVDGADFNNPFFGEQRGGQRPAFTFNLDAVQEMVVIANGANAEFGRSGGGFVNVITKSGTNTLHGSAHYYGKPGSLASDAEHAGIRNVPDFNQQQFGFTLGGPIVRDKAFFF
ncbi:MAG TPA: carboxypeptidase regulatory-like domain-containing protein, partial [Gemmatimonadaceae bacterium]|nr:carboxypeptidase regulatory-like domain-containing protein [Gemmatimonadaceae bacterium]